MKTKKLFYVAMVAMCAILTTSVMNSCNNTNNPDPQTEEPQQEDRTPVAAYIDYYYSTNDSMLNVFDIKLEYYDSEGKLQVENLTKTEWKLTAKSALPAKLGMRAKLAFKDGVEAETLPKMRLLYFCSFKTSAVDAKGNRVGEEKYNEFYNRNGFAGNKISVWLDSYQENEPVKFLFEYDANGKRSDINW